MNADDQTRVDALSAVVSDLRVALAQLQDLVTRVGGIPLPSKQLQTRVVGSYRNDFVRSGDVIADDLERILAPHGVNLRSFHSILDFGCGCGRILTAVARRLTAGQRLFGCDIDPEAIDWCRANYAQLADVSLCPHVPRTFYRDRQFAFVFGISVLTHLPEAMQFDWLRELERITAPGAYIILSVHGRNHLDSFPPAARQEVEQRGFCYADLGKTAGLPEFYLTTCHTERYIRDRWSEFFDVLDVVELGIHGRQDAVLCRRIG